MTKYIINTKYQSLTVNIHDLLDYLNVARANGELKDIKSIETIQTDKLCVCEQCCNAIRSRGEIFTMKPVDSIYNMVMHCDWCLENGFEELFDIQF